jgi:hypothetical protein
MQEEIENKVIDWIINGAGGRLIIFKPENMSDGANLIVAQKGGYEPEKNEDPQKSVIVKAQVFGHSSNKEAKEIQVSVNGQTRINDSSVFTKDINIDNFKTTDNFYIMFVFLNTFKHDIEDFLCFLPMKEFIKYADKTQSENILKFESFLSSDKKDKYSKFLINKKDLSKFLLNIMSKA